mmetsp:Transcript_22892/g.48423  ORF Transcript_22892/g.48423 Transcript_22892/m.48423 type:complete len:240 (+) Transcript_22892:828-1547(+)
MEQPAPKQALLHLVVLARILHRLRSLELPPQNEEGNQRGQKPLLAVARELPVYILHLAGPFHGHRRPDEAAVAALAAAAAAGAGLLEARQAALQEVAKNGKDRFCVFPRGAPGGLGWLRHEAVHDERRAEGECRGEGAGNVRVQVLRRRHRLRPVQEAVPDARVVGDERVVHSRGAEGYELAPGLQPELGLGGGHRRHFLPIGRLPLLPLPRPHRRRRSCPLQAVERELDLVAPLHRVA